MTGKSCSRGKQYDDLEVFLFISKEEQLARFKERVDNPAHQWKISASDYAERDKWDDSVEAFEAAMERCSTKHAPWFVIPSNHKWFRNLAVSSIIADALEDRNIQVPKPTVDIEEIRELYHQAEDRKGLKKSSLMIKLMGETRLRRSSSRERRCKAPAASSVFEALDNARMTWRHYAFWLIASGGALLGRAGLGGALEE